MLQSCTFVHLLWLPGFSVNMHVHVHIYVYDVRRVVCTSVCVSFCMCRKLFPGHSTVHD